MRCLRRPSPASSSDSSEPLPRIRNTQHGGQRPCGATPMTRFSCARAQLPASLADNGKPMRPRNKDRKTPLPQQAALSRRPHGRPRRLALQKADAPGKLRSAAARRSMLKYSRSINARNTPEYPEKMLPRAADRCAVRKALFFPPSPKIFCSNAPGADCSSANLSAAPI